MRSIALAALLLAYSACSSDTDPGAPASDAPLAGFPSAGAGGRAEERALAGAPAAGGAGSISMGGSVAVGGSGSGDAGTGGAGTGGMLPTGGTAASVCTSPSFAGHTTCPDPCELEVDTGSGPICYLRCHEATDAGLTSWPCASYGCADRYLQSEAVQRWAAVKC